MKAAVRFLFTLVLALSLSACEGFHLRGYGGGASLAAISPLYISGLDETDELYRILRAYLPQYGVTLVDKREAAKQELTIFDRQSNKKVHSVTGRGKVLEYELTEGFAYHLGSTPDAVERDSANRLSVSRVYTNPETEVLGRRNEETLIWRDMRQQLASRLVRLLSVQAK
ncbi:MAG: hypothetical protein KJ558_03815 [Gammaproteobacteria bacterium]|nr:hypothetical protein [Gammaproteobacteria bacterium]MBU1653950.1 hypothetical protein [Gammaproteobacteria bacterium]MBU1960154.1 hypothetical protein [Gammaproteobacteria bacterium]